MTTGPDPTEHLLTPAQSTFLQNVSALNVRPFTAAPGGEQLTGRGGGWQQLDPAGNGDRVCARQPRHTLCGELSSHAAIVDVDPRHGGIVEQTRELLRGKDFEVFAAVLTLRDGARFYVAGHPNLPIVFAAPGRNGFTGRPGVEVISSGHRAYLPGPSRPMYGGRGYEILFDNLAVDRRRERGRRPGVRRQGRANRTQNPAEFVPSPPGPVAPLDARERAYMNNALSGDCATLAGMGPDSGRNNTLTQQGHGAAVACGTLAELNDHLLAGGPE